MRKKKNKKKMMMMETKMKNTKTKKKMMRIKSPSWCIVSEFCDGGSLKQLLDNNTAMGQRTRLISLGIDISSGLAHLHANGFTHLNLSSRNVFITHNKTALLCDYGLAGVVRGTTAKSRTNHWKWTAPEVLEKKQTREVVDNKEAREVVLGTKQAREEAEKAADIWSLGVTFWEV